MKRFLLLLLFLPIFAFASIGKITVLKGDVTIKRAGDIIKAKSGTQLEKKDFISTDKNGKVQIVFSDKTIFTIGKNSTLDIADYLYDESKPKRNKAKFNVLKGAFSSITGKIGKLNKSKFKLKTKSASIGIRGTIVKANQETIMCTEGAITVETLAGSIRLEAGQKTVIVNGAPTPAAAIQPGDEEALGVNVIYNDQDGDGTLNEAIAKDVTIKVTEKIDSDALDSENAENIKKDTAANAVRDEVITGRAIDSSGKQQEITIESSNLQGDFTVGADSGLQMVDDSGNNIDSIKDNTITWGHWANDPSKKWVAGKKTDVKVLDDIRNNTEKVVNARYTGKVMGSVDGTDNIKMDGANNVQLDFKLGANNNYMEGKVDFDTVSGQQWRAKFKNSTNAVNGNSFSAGLSERGTINGKSVINQGGIDGNFYGKNREAVGGTAVMKSNEHTASTVFKATGQ